MGLRSKYETLQPNDLLSLLNISIFEEVVQSKSEGNFDSIITIEITNIPKRLIKKQWLSVSKDVEFKDVLFDAIPPMLNPWEDLRGYCDGFNKYFESKEKIVCKYISSTTYNNNNKRVDSKFKYLYGLQIKGVKTLIEKTKIEIFKRLNEELKREPFKVRAMPKNNGLNFQDYLK